MRLVVQRSRDSTRYAVILWRLSKDCPGLQKPWAIRGKAGFRERIMAVLAAHP